MSVKVTRVQLRDYRCWGSSSAACKTANSNSIRITSTPAPSPTPGSAPPGPVS